MGRARDNAGAPCRRARTYLSPRPPPWLESLPLACCCPQSASAGHGVITAQIIRQACPGHPPAISPTKLAGN